MAKADRSFLFCHGTDSLFWAFVCLGMFVLVQLQFSGNELRLSRKDVEEHRIPAKIHVCTVFNRVWCHNLWQIGNIADVLYGKPKQSLERLSNPSTSIPLILSSTKKLTLVQVNAFDTLL